MHFKILLLVGILVAGTFCLDCPGSNGLVLVSDMGNTFTSKITFDDQEWVESFTWDTSVDGSLNLTANGTLITFSGSGCQLGSGSYFSYINDEYWKGSDPWANSAEVPNFYMSTVLSTTECALIFDPPLRSFVAYTNSFASTTCSFFIYAIDGTMFDCSTNCPINAGENNYQMRGFVGNRPIHKILWANAWTAVDNILYELWCPDNTYKTDGVTEYCDSCSLNPCDPLATCLNAGTSFTCTCPDGYTGDGIGANGCQVIPPQAAPITSEPASNEPTSQPIDATPTSTPKSTPVAKTSDAIKLTLSASALVGAIALF